MQTGGTLHASMSVRIRLACRTSRNPSNRRSWCCRRPSHPSSGPAQGRRGRSSSGTSWRTLSCCKKPVPRAPAWLREFVPQALSVAVARRAGLLDGHLGEMELACGFTVREYAGPADAERQMEFQNLLLRLGAAALEEFGERFLHRLADALWKETEVIGEERAEELLAGSLDDGGWEWLEGRPEF